MLGLEFRVTVQDFYIFFRVQGLGIMFRVYKFRV